MNIIIYQSIIGNFSMSMDVRKKKQELLNLFENKENSLRIGLINGSPDNEKFYINLYIIYFIFESISTCLRVEGPYDRLTEFFSLLIKNGEVRTTHNDLADFRELIRKEIDDKESLSDDLTQFLKSMKKSDLHNNLYYFKDNLLYIKIGNRIFTDLLIELYSRIHPSEDNYIRNFLSTIRFEMRRKTSEDDDEFGPITNLKRRNPKILIRTDATKDIARIIIENNNELKGFPPEKFETYWTFLSLYYSINCKEKLQEIYFNNTILVGMSYHSISDYVNCTPLRAYLTHHIFNTELGQDGLILSAFPLMGLLTRHIKENNKNYFKEPPNLRDFLIPSLGDCFWLTDSKNIKYFDLLTATPTSGRTMYDGIPSVLVCKIEQKEIKVEELLPKWNLIDINKLNKFWSNVALEFEDMNLSIKSKTHKKNALLTIDSENILNSIEHIRKTSTIERPLRIAQYYSWLKDLNWEFEKILTNNHPRSAAYIQSKYGLTPLEFKEIIAFYCSMGWLINQSFLLKSKTKCEDDLRANAEIVSILSSLHKYRKNHNGKYITYSTVINNAKKYAYKEKIKKIISLKKDDSLEYTFLIKWLLKERDRFEEIQRNFNVIKEGCITYHVSIPGIKASSFNKFIDDIFVTAENNIRDIVSKRSKSILRINYIISKQALSDIETILGIPISVFTAATIMIEVGFPITSKMRLTITGVTLLLVLIYYILVKKQEKQF